MHIHLIGGEKGGPGKSFFCRSLASYLLCKKTTFTLFECDRSNPDVARIYGKSVPCRYAIFSESDKHEDSPNKIFNQALEEVCLVNLPAQCFTSIKNWVENNEILEESREAGIQIFLWFVSDCGYDSLNLLAQSLSYFETKVHHILVRNFGKNDDWSALNEDAVLTDLLGKCKAKSIDFPKFLGTSDRNKIDRLSLTFEEAKASDHLDRIGRRRVQQFLRKTYTELDQLEIFDEK